MDTALTIRKTHDVRRWYGWWAAGGTCRIRIFEAPGRVPVIVCSQIEAESNWSISVVVQYLAAVVIAKYLPHRFEEPEPVVWLEHYPNGPARRPRGVQRLDVSRVTFAHWRPVIGQLGGVQQTRLGQPAWTPLTADEVVALIGDADLLAE